MPLPHLPLTRRESMRVGGLAALGLSLPQLLASGSNSQPTRAKRCIVLFLLGGPPQHSTWDPKPDAPAEIRGEFGPIDTKVPGIRIASLFPKLAKQTDKICFLRAMSTGDNAHSSSGYAMHTGVPHAPLNAEGVNPGPPNDSPALAALVRKLRGDRGGLPGSVRLPMHIFNTDSSIWPGQDAGYLGRSSDPWLFRCEPGSPKFNGNAGRDHWGSVFSVALAGGGIKGGQVYGASDKVGGYPKDGKVTPADLTATALHCLGIDPASEVHDALKRPVPASRGTVIRGIL